ncbi:MAG: 4Fe-4S binding protein [Candidatus Fimivivens sp.]
MALKKKQPWYDYLWIATITYLILGLFNILFAWIGLICFITPLLISITKGDKSYCNKYCGRGKLFGILGEKISFNNNPPAFIRSKCFRYGFLIFFMTMFIMMLYTTFQVFRGQEVQEVLTILWTFKLPWNWGADYHVAPFVVQFAFGFYSVMLTSSILGFMTMIIYRPRTWCVYCPMGTMTQGICILKHRNDK